MVWGVGVHSHGSRRYIVSGPGGTLSGPRGTQLGVQGYIVSGVGVHSHRPRGNAVR